MAKSNLLEIPGIGKTFARDFARINIFSISELADQNADELFLDLCRAHEMVDHKIRKNYLYVIRWPFTMRTVVRTNPSFSGILGKPRLSSVLQHGDNIDPQSFVPCRMAILADGKPCNENGSLDCF